MLESSQRMAVVDAARRLAARGLVTGTAGNLSARAGELVAVTPTGAALEQLEPEQVVLVDLAGGLVDGRLEPTSELGLHLGIYHRYDAGAVIHAHPPMATALACVLDELPVVHYEMLAFGGPVRVAPYATFGTDRLAELTLDALAGRNVALMANHGAIAFAADLKTAARHMGLLEWASTVYWRAAAVGTPKVLDSEQQQEVVKAAVERGYGATHEVGG